MATAIATHRSCGKPEIGYATEFLISLPVTN
jgi:hypothetical protein